MITKVSNLYTIPLQPGRNTFKNPGRFFRLIQSTVPIGVKLGDLPEITLSAGQCIPFEAPDEFTRYELITPLAELLIVRF